MNGQSSAPVPNGAASSSSNTGMGGASPSPAPTARPNPPPARPSQAVLAAVAARAASEAGKSPTPGPPPSSTPAPPPPSQMMPQQQASTSNGTYAPQQARTQPQPPVLPPIPAPPRLANGQEIPLPPQSDPDAEMTRQLLIKREQEEAAKDRTLAELLGMLDGYRPVIPEEVTDYYLQRSGFESHDPRLNRLLSISAEKFISDIVSDAYQYSRIRTNASSGRPPAATSAANAAAAAAGVGVPGSGAGAASSGGAAGGPDTDKSRTVLTMDDLSAALGEYGINAKRAESYR